MSSFAPQTNPGSFVPTTDIWDVANIYDVDVNSDQFKELIVRLRQNINDIALVLNTKETGYYYQQEIVNGNVFFPDPALSSLSAKNPTQRQESTKLVNFGALPNTATKSVAHGLTMTEGYHITRHYCWATQPGVSPAPPVLMIPVPYSSTTALANNIEINVDSTNINITTGIDRTAFTKTFVILKFIKE